MSAQIEQALTDARRQLDDMYGDRLKRAILFGSQARGDAHSASDVDVLVILGEPLNVYEETKRLVWLGIDLFERYRFDFSFKPYSETDYHDLRRPLMKNIHAEGIEL